MALKQATEFGNVEIRQLREEMQDLLNKKEAEIAHLRLELQRRAEERKKFEVESATVSVACNDFPLSVMTF